MSLTKHKQRMDIARTISAMSKDRSTQVGCVVVGEDGEPLTWGYNGFPRGADDSAEYRHERPLKYKWTEHAERNAIFNAARTGVRLKGGSIYVTSLVPCPDCARGIIQAGIKTIYVEERALDNSNPRAKAWLEDWETTQEMLVECGVTLEVLPSE